MKSWDWSGLKRRLTGPPKVLPSRKYELTIHPARTYFVSWIARIFSLKNSINSG
jgi:hypothetical protein